MSLLRPIQEDFSAGQVSERMRARSNYSAFLTGLLECKNFVPTPQGMLRRRFGTKHSATIDASTGKLVDFYTSDDQSLCVAFTDNGRATIFDPNAPLLDGEPVVLYDSSVDKFNVDSSNLNVFHVEYTDLTVPYGDLEAYDPSGNPHNQMEIRSYVFLESSTYNGLVFELNCPAGDENQPLVIEMNIDDPLLGAGTWLGTSIRIGSTVGNSDVYAGFEATPPNSFVINTSFRGNSKVYVHVLTASNTASAGQVPTSQITYLKAYIQRTSNMDISSGSYDSISYDPSTQDASPQDIFFKPDGLSMFVLGDTTKDIFQYTLSTAWDPSSATYASKLFAADGQASDPVSFYIGDSGTKLYILDGTSKFIYQYTLSTAWDISTASYSSISLDIKTESLIDVSAGTAASMDLGSDGAYLIYVNKNGGLQVIYRWALGTDWDISTAVWSHAVDPGENDIQDAVFSEDGQNAWFLDADGDTVETLTLVSGSFAVDSAIDSSQPLDISNESGDASSIFMHETLGHIFITDPVDGLIYRYTTIAPTGYVEFDHAYTAEDLPDLQWDFHPIEDELWVTHRRHQPSVLVYDASAASFTWVGAISDNKLSNEPSNWSTPPTFGDPPNPGDSFPRAIAFHQGRLWLFGTLDEKNAVYATAADGGFNTFLSPTTTTASSPIQLYLAAKCTIQWAASSGELYIGTTLGLGIITSDSKLLGSTEIVHKWVSRLPVNKVKAVFASSFPIIASLSGDQVVDVVPSEDGTDNLSKELTFDHQGILNGSSIDEMSYRRRADNPINILSGGVVSTCYYNKHLQKIGWAQHILTSRVESIVSLDVRSSSPLAYLLRNPSGKLSMVNEVDGTYMDDYIDINNGSPTTEVYAPHLAGQTVQVMGDQIQQADVTLDATGYGEIETAATTVRLGYTYLSKIKTMPKGMMLSVLQQISSSFKSWHKIYVYLLNSINPKVQGYKKPDTLDDDDIPVASTRKLKVTDRGWDDEGFIEIEQEEPYACDILSIFGSMSEEDV